MFINILIKLCLLFNAIGPNFLLFTIADPVGIVVIITNDSGVESGFFTITSYPSRCNTGTITAHSCHRIRNVIDK